MNRFNLLLLSLALAVSAGAQSTFRYLYRGHGSCYAYDLIASNDQGFLIVGLADSTIMFPSDGFLLKTDQAGQIIWKKTIQDSNLVLRKVIPANDGGYLCIGLDYGVTDQDDDDRLLLLKISESGDIDWTRRITTKYPSDYYIQSLIAVPPDKYMFFESGYLNTLDNSGMLVGQKWVDYFASNAVYDPAGLIYATGTKITGSSSLSGDGTLAKFRPDGTMLWARQYKHPAHQAIYALQQLPGGNLVISGISGIASPIQDNHLPWVLQTDTAGQPIWSKVYRMPDRDQYAKVTACANGDILLSLLPDVNEFDYAAVDGLLLRLDPAGQLRWAKAYGTYGQDFFEKAIELPDGGLAAAGFLLELGPRWVGGAFLVRTDPAGNIPGCCVRDVAVETYDMPVETQDYLPGGILFTAPGVVPYALNDTPTDLAKLDLCDVIAPDIYLSDSTVCQDSCLKTWVIWPSWAQYQWSFSGATPAEAIGTNPEQVCFQEPGARPIRLTGSWEGCTSVVLDTITVQRACVCRAGKTPNAFTPNHDDINDTFIPAVPCDVAGYSFSVFNRWGQLVFETSDPQAQWTGTFGDQELPTDVYVWKIQYRIDTPSGPELIKKSGDITILR